MIQWARKLMGDHEIVEMPPPGLVPEEDREATVGVLKPGSRSPASAAAP